MRLTRYINEGIKEVHVWEMDQLVDLIKKDCSQYLKLLKGRKPLFRGIQNDHWYHVGIKKVRQNRRPRLMNKDVVKYVDKYLTKRGLPLRTKSMICTSSEYAIEKFGGQRCFVYPIGKFKFAMVKSDDMNYTNIKTSWSPINLEHNIDNYYTYYIGTEDGDDIKKDIDKMLNDNIDGNNQKAFDEAYKNEYEMWFDCKKYYYVDISGKFSGIYNMF